MSGDVIDDESTPLIGEVQNNSFRDIGRRACQRCKEVPKRTWGIVFLILFLVILSFALFFYFNYYRGSIKLNILSYNVWGLPGGIGGCKDKEERIEALSKVVESEKYDLITLQELWMQPDHDFIQASLPQGYHMTGFRELASSLCDGRVLPTTCSGLSIISKFPFLETEFHMYSDRGSIWDAEAFAGKGIGRVRIKLKDDLDVDVFTTHTIADSGTTMANNTAYRIKQVKELMNDYVLKSGAKVVILAGDFNTEPKMNTGEPFEIIRRHMTNSIEEIFYKLNEWLRPSFATYGNKLNTFTNQMKPQTLDYIFHKTNSPDVIVWTNWFELPFFKTTIFKETKNEAIISLSDHEAVHSTMYIKK